MKVRELINLLSKEEQCTEVLIFDGIDFLNIERVKKSSKKKIIISVEEEEEDDDDDDDEEEYDTLYYQDLDLDEEAD